MNVNSSFLSTSNATTTGKSPFFPQSCGPVRKLFFDSKGTKTFLDSKLVMTPSTVPLLSAATSASAKLSSSSKAEMTPVTESFQSKDQDEIFLYSDSELDSIYLETDTSFGTSKLTDCPPAKISAISETLQAVTPIFVKQKDASQPLTNHNTSPPLRERFSLIISRGLTIR
jgi:hypothetical protein